MLREIAVARLAPGRLARYLRARLRRAGSSYWRDPVRAAGLDPERVRAEAQGQAALAFLEADAQELAELERGGEAILLVSNQEVVPVGSRAELRHALAAARELARGARGEEARPPPPGAVAHEPGLVGLIGREEATALLSRALSAAPESARGRIAAARRAISAEERP
jgi:hypothetical protein